MSRVYLRIRTYESSQSNVDFSVFELTPRLLPTFKASLLSTRSFCFNGEEIST